MASKSSKIKTAASYGAQIVRESFVWDCISAKVLLDPSSYLLAVVHFNSIIFSSLLSNRTWMHLWHLTHQLMFIQATQVSSYILLYHLPSHTLIEADKENKTENIYKATPITSTTKPLRTSDHQTTFSFGAVKPSTSQIDPKVQVFLSLLEFSFHS